MSIVSRMREDAAVFRKFVQDNSDDADIALYPIVPWGDQNLIVTGKIKLRTGMQRLEVIECPQKVAVFAGTWPPQGGGPPYALVAFPSEGHVSVFTESGMWVWVHMADLAIRVDQGTKEDRKAVREAQMEELEEGGIGHL